MKLSVVTVCYNDCVNLEKTINSVISQDYADFEYIVIDGGSTDGTMDILKKYEDFIAFSISERDKGIYDAMNKSLKYVTGTWVLFLNAGDTFIASNTLSDIFDYRFDSDIDVVYGNTISVSPIGRVKCIARDLPPFGRTMPFVHQSVIVRVDVLKRYKFDISYRLLADMNLFYNLFRDGIRFLHIPVFISYYENGGASAQNPVLFFSEQNRIFGRGNILVYAYRMVLLKIKICIIKIMPNKVLIYLRQLKHKRSMLDI